MWHRILLIGWTVLATLVLGTLIIVVARFSRSGDLPHRIARFWAHTILVVGGVRVKIKGEKYIDRRRPYIYMANHASFFDIPVLLAHLNVPFRWLAKAELFRLPVFGKSMEGCGCIRVERSNRRKAHQSLVQAARIIRQGTSVLIFPEGTRSADGCLLPFKTGGFLLAITSGVPIIPVVVHGTWQLLPKGTLRTRTGTAGIEILPPLTASSGMKKVMLCNQTRAVMQKALNRAGRNSGR